MTVARALILALALQQKEREQKKGNREYFGPADMLCVALQGLRPLPNAAVGTDTETQVRSHAPFTRCWRTPGVCLARKQSQTAAWTVGPGRFNLANEFWAAIRKCNNLRSLSRTRRMARSIWGRPRLRWVSLPPTFG